jgi:Cof subfamily protein (haloacid dehalogenase superfamily)
LIKRLVALDLDGTILHGDFKIDSQLASHIRTVHDAGHEVVISTGRSVDATLPIIEALNITPTWVVCCNGAVVLRRDALADRAYRWEFVETFDTTDVLTRIRTHLITARYAVEDAEGFFRFTEPLPDDTLGQRKARVTFDELLGIQATRVVVVSPDHQLEEFLSIVDQIGLTHVSYAIGWTAWLDIAPEGITKATALERVREILEIEPTQVIAVGDGRNDIDMLQWAARHGVSVAMGQASQLVRDAANEVTASIEDAGLTRVLEREFAELIAATPE